MTSLHPPALGIAKTRIAEAVERLAPIDRELTADGKRLLKRIRLDLKLLAGLVKGHR